MDQLALSRTLLNRRNRPPTAGPAMVALTQLLRNPVAIEVTDASGAHSISAERGKNGKVWLTCQCAQSTADGWCRHRLDLICMRYDAAKEASAETRQAFEQILNGTPLYHAGRDADRALTAFEETLRVFDQRRPADVSGRDLAKFTDLVSDLAACAAELEDALGNLRRLLERT